MSSQPQSRKPLPPDRADAQRPIEVAIIGGGCAATSAAFDLTRPELAGQYHVTIYQQGWRLGGKGASGRGPGDRIEEHGLHIWMGFYENAFRLMRECYAELDRDPAQCHIARWDDAFKPDPLTGVVDARSGDTSSHWIAHFPPGAGTPGDPDAPRQDFSVAEYMVRAVQLVQTLLQSARRELSPTEPTDEPTEPSAGKLLEDISRFARYGQLATLTGVIEGTQLLAAAMRAATPLPTAPLLTLIDRVGVAAHSQLEALIEGDLELCRIFEIVDLVLAILRGSIRFGLAVHPQGFDAINDYDWREWLLMNGASERAAYSPFLHSLYDLAFAYEDGDKSRPSACAGSALRCAVRAFLTYRGSFFWKMSAGMGDIVFTPLYEVLKRRGVRFEFFHRLENVGVVPAERLAAGETPWVETLEFDVQAETSSGDEYQPLVDVRGLPCWPSEPQWEQLARGEQLRAEGLEFESFWDRRFVGKRTLRVGEEFDLVVLGVGCAAIPYVAPELVARDERFANAVREVKTVATHAFQLWLGEPLETLGWTDPPLNITGIPGTYETWADMRQLIPEESFPEPPKAIAYFCSALHTPDPPPREEATYPADQQKRVRDLAIDYLNQRIGRLWPQAVREGRFRFDWLVDAEGRPLVEDGDVSAFETQFWQANVNPSDRYTLAVPGSAQHRISPLERRFDNLTVAGDWTACGLDIGCVEAAVMSGRLAAHALSGSPALEEIIGYDHP